MTTNQIIERVRRKVLEEGDEIIDDEDILFHMQEAYKDVKKRTFTNADVSTDTVALVDGSGDLPEGFGTLYDDAYDDSGNPYPEVSIADFRKRTLPRMVTIEEGQLKVYPVSVSSLTILHWTAAEELQAGDSEPDIDPYFHKSIYLGTLAEVYGDLQDEELADHYSKKYEDDLEKRIAHQSAYEETNQRGAVMFTPQTLISGGGVSVDPDGFNL